MVILSAFIKATKEKVFDILSDYRSYADWTADVIDSTILAQDDLSGIVVAEFLSPALMDDKYVLEFVQLKPTSIEYKQVDQYGSRGLSGRWHIEETRGQPGVTITGEMNLKTSLWERSANKKRVKLILQRRLDVLHQTLTPPSPGEAEGLPNFEAIEDGEEFILRFLGHKYHVKKVD